METEIYYFSGTGNSFHVAREFQRRLPKTVLLPIVSLLGNETISLGQKSRDCLSDSPPAQALGHSWLILVV